MRNVSSKVIWSPVFAVSTEFPSTTISLITISCSPVVGPEIKTLSPTESSFESKN